jgi:hypothetical protein
LPRDFAKAAFHFKDLTYNAQFNFCFRLNPFPSRRYPLPLSRPASPPPSPAAAVAGPSTQELEAFGLNRLSASSFGNQTFKDRATARRPVAYVASSSSRAPLFSVTREIRGADKEAESQRFSNHFFQEIFMAVCRPLFTENPRPREAPGSGMHPIGAVDKSPEAGS